MNNCNKLIISFFLILKSITSFGQDFTPLINIAWENNATLRSKSFKLESATLALNEAKAMYGPDIKFGVQYTLANGGRSISFPVGDLLNPVYSTLNSLTQSTAFPQIENVNEQFLPNNFYDARVRISQPIFYPDLAINKTLKKETIEMQKLEIKAFKRYISKDVMSAWFQYQSALAAVAIYKSADTLLVEARRATQSMIRNGIALSTALSRIDNQSAIIRSQEIESMANIKNAENYMRFVLGIKENEPLPVVLNVPKVPSLEMINSSSREELQQIAQAMKIGQLGVNKENNFYLPRIGAQIDAGSQDFDLGWKPYLLLGINVEVNIFDSKKHKYRKQAVQSDLTALQHQSNQIQNEINLQVKVSQENLKTALLQAETFDARIMASRKIYNEVYARYKEGNVGYLELIDAQTQYTQMQIQYLIFQNNAWLKWSEYVYATAIYPIN